MPVFATAPMVIQESLLFPYLSGAEFVQRFKEKKGKANPFADIPRSTEQVLHTRAYFGTPADEPTTVTLPAPRGATKVYENDIGEFGTRLLLYQHLERPARRRARRGRLGWRSLRGRARAPGDAASCGRLVWDSSLEAAEFSDASLARRRSRTGAPERSVAGGGATFTDKGRTITDPSAQHRRSRAGDLHRPPRRDGRRTSSIPPAITLGK